jgi:hypothetical protein
MTGAAHAKRRNDLRLYIQTIKEILNFKNTLPYNVVETCRGVP